MILLIFKLLYLFIYLLVSLLYVYIEMSVSQGIKIELRKYLSGVSAILPHTGAGN